MKLLVGIDVGSTIVKATVFDLQGHVVATGAEPTPTRHRRPGWVERDPEATWRLAARVVQRSVIGRAQHIVAVGVTGCGNGAVFLDQRKRPVLPGILSSDTRAASLVRAQDSAWGQVAYPGQLRILLGWLRATGVSAAQKTAHALCWKDYVRFRLTGSLATDYTDAGAAGLLNLPRRELRQPEPLLPEIRESLAQAGAVTRSAARATGLAIGTPVFVGCIDCEAAAIGSGVQRPGEVSVVAGTWSINQAYTRNRPRSSGHFLTNVSVSPDRWLVVEASACSAGNFDWARRVLGGDANEATMEAARARPSELLFLPRVPTFGGAFVGLGSSHGRGDLFRAVMEGVVFAHRCHLESLSRSVKPITRLYLSGGAANNRLWCQLFADGIGRAVHVPRCAQVGALGAAVCAAVGAGFFGSLPAAQKAMLAGHRIYRPNRERHAALTQRFLRYRQLSLQVTG